MNETESRFQRLEQRVDTLEARLLSKPPTQTKPTDVAERVAAVWASIARPLQPEQNTPAIPTRSPAVRAAPAIKPPSIPPLSNVALAYEPPLPSGPLISDELEHTLGLKWTGWIGAVTLIFGGVLGVKFMYDNGWFGIAPPWLRLTGIFLTGLSLIGLGEWVLRKVHAVPAACLFGAGVATLFVAGYTGNAYFELYSVSVAQLTMLLATLVGAAIAVRANLVSIGVLALVGGNLAPLVVGQRDAAVESFLLYLLMLQTVALLLTHVGRGGKWWTLRGLSLATMTFWIGTIIDRGYHGWILPTTMLLSAAGFYAELIATTLRRDATNAGQNTGTVFSLFLAAALVAGGLAYWSAAGRLPRTEWVLLLATLFGLSGAVLPKIQPRLSALAKTHCVAAAALLIFSVPMALAGDSLLIGWTMLAVLLAAIHRRGGSAIARYAAVGTWLAGLAYAGLITIARFSGATDSIAHLLGNGLIDLHLPTDSVGALLIATAGFVIARLVSRPRAAAERDGANWNALAETVSALSTLALAMTTWLNYSVPTGVITLIGVAWLLLIARKPLRPLNIAWRGVILLLVAVARLGWSDVSAYLLGRHTLDLLPIVNLRFALYAATAASLAVLYRLDGDALCINVRGNVTAASRALVRERFTLGIAALLAWACSAEALRVVATLHRSVAEAWHLQSLLLSSVWLTAALAAKYALRRIDQVSESAKTAAAVLPALVILAAIKYVIVDTLGWRLFYSPLTDGIAQTIEVASAAVLIAMTCLMSAPRGDDGKLHSGFALLTALLMLWAGSVQLDRTILGSPAWITFSNPQLALLVALSIYWAVLAVAAVMAGFAQRLAALRYFGLALLGVTLLKVVLVDLSAAGTGYRIVSFIGLGVVLIGTSIVYGKITPQLREAAN